MLTAEVIGTGQTTGEVRQPRCKMGWNRAAGAGQGSRDGDYAAMEATVAPFCLPVRLDFGYSAVSRGQTCASGNVGQTASIRSAGKVTVTVVPMPSRCRW